MEKLKIGIIGCGNISWMHFNSYKQDDRVELYAFCDLEIDKAVGMCKTAGVEPEGRTFTDVDEMLKLEELDAVSICTWNNAHSVCAIKALKAGKHVLCEKPMALNTALAEDMMKAQEESGKLLMIGFVRRYGDDCRLLKEYNDTGFFGDVYYTKVKNLRRHGNPGGWFIDKARSGGGPLIDLGVHIMDLMCYVLGDENKPVSVYAATFNKLGNRPELKDIPLYSASRPDPNVKCSVEDLASAMIRFENGAVMTVEVSFDINQPKTVDSTIEVYGSKGGAFVDDCLTLTSSVGERMCNINLTSNSGFDFGASFARETRHFVDCILDPSTECQSPSTAGLKLMKIIDAIYESAETGHESVIKW